MGWIESTLVAFGGSFLVLGIVFAIGTWLARRKRERSEAMAQVAQMLGFTFDPKPAEFGLPAASGILFLARGHSGRAANALRGAARGGGEEHLFEWNFVVGRGKGRQFFQQTVAVFRDPGAALPSFAMQPERILVDRLSEFFGGQDIDFGESPDFSRAYRLRGPDEARVRARFGPGVLSHFAAQPGWTVEAKGEWLLACRVNDRVRPEGLSEFLDAARAIRRVFGKT